MFESLRKKLKKKPLKESHKRSMVRSILWRIMGVGILAAITYLFTGNWITTGLITFFHHFSFIWIYYLHERLWQKIGDKVNGKKRSILRAFLYEIVLGHGILGLISLIFTGNWSTVTWITITYIENKLWIYVVYDWLWKKIKWQTK